MGSVQLVDGVTVLRLSTVSSLCPCYPGRGSGEGTKTCIRSGVNSRRLRSLHCAWPERNCRPGLHHASLNITGLRPLVAVLLDRAKSTFGQRGPAKSFGPFWATACSLLCLLPKPTHLADMKRHEEIVISGCLRKLHSIRITISRCSF